MRKNIFVIGDLVIDHTIFVRERPRRAHQTRSGEPVYEVVRRLNSAGGAANTARHLASTNEGNTYLWGPVGQHSPWGTFREVLERSQELDASPKRVVFRSLTDESGARTHTISRIISVSGEPPNFFSRRHWVRFDDYDDFYLDDRKRLTVLDDLAEIHRKDHLGAVIINDLDLNCVTQELVASVSDFCSQQRPRIPLFVDPKFDPKKYADVNATAILPNLDEWASLVAEGDRVDQWRKNLDAPHSLLEMAQLTIWAFRSFEYYVIKCDRDGCVVLCPSGQGSYYDIYRIRPAMVHKDSNQLGPGDVLVGALALNLDEPSSAGFLKAVQVAESMAADYLKQPWLQMPPQAGVEPVPSLASRVSDPVKTFPAGVKYLPKDTFVALSAHQSVRGLYTFDAKFKKAVSDIMTDVEEGWGNDLRSLIVGAPPGSGKTEIAKAVKALSLPNFLAKDLSDILSTFDSTNPSNNLTKLEEAAKGARLFLIVDEALKAENRSFLERSGVLLLNAAHKLGMRFLLMDSNFFPNPGVLGIELSGRCRLHTLPALEDRPEDISLILASYLLADAKKRVRLELEANALLGLINHQLQAFEKLSPRHIITDARELEGRVRGQMGGVMRIETGHLPDGWHQPNIILPKRVGDYVFTL